MNSFMNWAGFLLGGSAISIVLLAIFAPSVLTVASSWLKALAPLVKGLAEGIVGFVKLLIKGFKDILDNFNTIVTVLSLILVSFMYGKLTYGVKTEKCAVSLSKLREDYKFIKRTPAEKARYLKGKGGSSWKDFLQF